MRRLFAKKSLLVYLNPKSKSLRHDWLSAFAVPLSRPNRPLATPTSPPCLEAASQHPDCPFPRKPEREEFCHLHLSHSHQPQP